jgi:hypothetical protein
MYIITIDGEQAPGAFPSEGAVTRMAYDITIYFKFSSVKFFLGQVLPRLIT